MQHLTRKHIFLAQFDHVFQLRSAPWVVLPNLCDYFLPN